MKQTTEQHSTDDLTSPAEIEINFKSAPRWPWFVPGGVTSRILDIVSTWGEVTAKEISGDLGVPNTTVTSILCRLCKKRKCVPQVIYIDRYVYEAYDERRYPRPVFKMGAKKNAKRPAVDRNARQVIYIGKSARRATTSIFDLALSQRDRMGGKRVKLLQESTNAGDL